MALDFSLDDASVQPDRYFLTANDFGYVSEQRPVIALPVLVLGQASGTQCSVKTTSTPVYGSTVDAITGLADLYLDSIITAAHYECTCVAGLDEARGVCQATVPFAARPGGIATVMLCTLLGAAVIAFAMRRLRARFSGIRDDLHLHKRLLEHAEDEVMALKSAWEISAEEVTLVARIDGASPGAFGAVWRGDWDGVAVAVKVLRVELMALDETTVAEFEKEAEFMMRARHPNLVRFFGAGKRAGGEPFLVLELVGRGSLRGYLRGADSKRLPWPVRRPLAADVARGMQYIHELDQMHRDLKSGNVLVTDQWRGKVADFGSIRSLLLGQHRQAQQGERTAPQAAAPASAEMSLTSGVGTPLYMAPEVIAGAAYDKSADVWSFGVLLVELAEERAPDLLEQEGDTGRGPLMGRLLGLLEKGSRLRLSPAVRNDAQAAWVAGVVDDCFAADPAARPSFAQLLGRLAGEGGGDGDDGAQAATSL